MVDTLSPNQWWVYVFGGDSFTEYTLSSDWARSQSIVWVVRDTATLHLTLNACHDDAEITCHVLVIWSQGSKPQCTVNWILSWQRSRINIRLMSFVGAQSFAIVHGGIDITPWAIHASWHLLEENIILDPSARIHVLPKLDVHTHDVSASHGAKIHTLDPAKLFYLHAKWLSPYLAKKIMISWHITDMFSLLSDEAYIAEATQEIVDELLVQ
jgi:Fe-S cluster assembly scaffold protein SufB